MRWTWRRVVIGAGWLAGAGFLVPDARASVPAEQAAETAEPGVGADAQEASAEEPALEEDYCGDGGSALLSDAWSAAEAGEYGVVHRLLVTALQAGRVVAWEKPDVLVLLARAQLELGLRRGALRNYRVALERFGVTEARAGLAVAEAAVGRVGDAVRTAEEHVATECRWIGESSPASCHTALTLLSHIAPSPSARDEAAARAGAQRAAQAWALEAYDEEHATILALVR